MSGRSALLVVSTLLLTASLAFAGDGVPQSYGKGVSDPADVVPISTLLASPGEYVDRTVRVSGPVVGVCKKRGCWMEIASDAEFQKLQIKVEDGEIVFPMDLMGERVVAEGVFTAIPLTMEQTCAYLEHEATCQGESFDRETITEPMTLYRIQGTGAVVAPAPAGEDAPADAAS